MAHVIDAPRARFWKLELFFLRMDSIRDPENSSKVWTVSDRVERSLGEEYVSEWVWEILLSDFTSFSSRNLSFFKIIESEIWSRFSLSWPSLPVLISDDEVL